MWLSWPTPRSLLLCYTLLISSGQSLILTDHVRCSTVEQSYQVIRNAGWWALKQVLDAFRRNRSVKSRNMKVGTLTWRVLLLRQRKVCFIVSAVLTRMISNTAVSFSTCWRVWKSVSSGSKYSGLLYTSFIKLATALLSLHSLNAVATT